MNTTLLLALVACLEWNQEQLLNHIDCLGKHDKTYCGKPHRKLCKSIIESYIKEEKAKEQIKKIKR